MSKPATQDTLDQLIQGLIAIGIEEGGNKPPIPKGPATPVPAPAGMTARCQHVMPSGRRCRAGRIQTARLCFFHGRQHARRCYEADGNGHATLGHEIPEVEDRASIQIAINEVIRSLARNWIDSKKAGLLLYGLNIALQNLRNDDAYVIAREDAVTQTTEVYNIEDLVVFSPAEQAEFDAEIADCQKRFLERKAAHEAQRQAGEPGPPNGSSHLVPADDPIHRRPQEFSMERFKASMSAYDPVKYPPEPPA